MALIESTTIRDVKYVSSLKVAEDLKMQHSNLIKIVLKRPDADSMEEGWYMDKINRNRKMYWLTEKMADAIECEILEIRDSRKKAAPTGVFAGNAE